MNIIVTFLNLFALILGIVTIGIAFRLIKNYKLLFLHYYLYFLICSVISGFFDWISFNWIFFLGPEFTQQSVDIVYHIFWDLLGFPCALFALFFLYSTIMRLIEIEFTRKRRNAFLVAVLILTILSFTNLIFRFQKITYLPSHILWILFLYILPLIQLSILLFGFHKTASLKHSVQIYSRRFITILFSGYAAWCFLMLLPVNIGAWRHLTIIVFYVALFLPTFYLHTYFGSRKNIFEPNDSCVEKLQNFFNSVDLTEREKEVMRLLIGGRSNRQIADELFISHQTVKNYVSRIYKRLNLRSRLELINFIRNSI